MPWSIISIASIQFNRLAAEQAAAEAKKAQEEIERKNDEERLFLYIAYFYFHYRINNLQISKTRRGP